MKKRTQRTTIAVALATVLVVTLVLVFRGGSTAGSGREVSADELRRVAGNGGVAKGHNVLLITVDTLRADRLGCHGYSLAATPAIDGLASRGIRFGRAMSTAPITLPSHSSVLTGLYVPNHGARHNGTFTLAEEKITLAEILKSQGYATGAFVGAYVLDGRYGLKQGFDHYDDNVNPQGLADPGGHFNERGARFVADSTLAWLEGQVSAGGPFFAWAHFFDPHLPYHAPGRYGDQHPGRPYDAEISYVDSQIERLVSFLDVRGLTDRTLVVLAADHGESLGEHGEDTHTVFIYDATIHVPLIISSPGLFPSPLTYGGGVVSLVDIVPTVLALLGVQVSHPMDGRDVLGDPPGPDRTVYFESMAPFFDHGWAPLFGLGRAADKFIHAPEKEYYDLSRDPRELDNLHGRSDASRELEAELEKLMSGWESVQDAISREVPLDPEQLSRLEALGYIRSQEGGARGVADPKRKIGLWNQIRRAESLSERGQHPQAVEEIRKVLRLDPRNGKAWYAATRIFRLAGEPRLSELAVETAVQLSPRSDGFVTLAVKALQRKDVAGFERALAQAAVLDPRDGGIYIARGDRLAIAGRFGDAIVEFQKAAELDPWRSGPRARAKIQAARARLKPQ